MRIVIIGAGEIGRAIEKILSVKGRLVLTREKKRVLPKFSLVGKNNIFIWDKDQGKVSHQKSLEKTLPQAHFVFVCVPSFAVEEVLKKINPLIDSKTIIISLSKGINDRAETMAEIFEKNIKKGFWGLLCGPMLAEEIMAGKNSFAVLAIENEENYKKISRLFSETSLQIFHSRDVRGSSVASVLKNIYSIFFGICDGLNVGNNFKGMLFVKMLEEMKKIILFFGGQLETAESLAGLGDFFATATSGYSKNYQNGVEISKNGAIISKGEGIASFDNLKKRIGDKIDEFHLLKILDKILKNPGKAEIFLKSLK